MSEYIHEILPEGPTDAKVMLVGEAPGETEVKHNRPFVGMAGMMLDSMLEEVGLARGACYLTNVMRVRPAGNRFANFYIKEPRKKAIASPELERGRARVLEEIAHVKPDVVVPLGNEPMLAVLGHSGVADWRGSVLQGQAHGHSFMAVPTYHPSFLLRQWGLRVAAVSDLRKAGELVGRTHTPTTRERIVCYQYETAVRELESILKEAKSVSYDIETESDQITCIGFGTSPRRAICIPFWFDASGSLFDRDQEARLWGLIAEILSREDIEKYAHNGIYDAGVLRRTLGLHVRGLTLDTQLLMHAVYAELPKSLAFAVSIFTDQPYYKYERKTADMDTLFKYNATDCCVTYEIAQKLVKEAEETEVLGFYQQYMLPLVDVFTQAECTGVRFDTAGRNRLRRVYRRGINRLQRLLEAQAGRELNVGSNKQMTEWLYGELGMPKQYNTDKATGRKALTADEEALEKLYKLKGIKALKTCLAIRKRNKVLTTYLGVELDEDKRIRCSYNLTGAETGRLSSSKTLRGTGTNLQNIPGGCVKRLFIADEGCILINADLSQAEARVVAYLANERRLIDVFDQGGDIHRKNAANVFGKREEDVTDEERQLAKRVVHASNYMMGPRTFAQQTGLPEARTRALLSQYFATYPRIREWHLATKAALNKTRVLRTPLGRRRVFFSKWSDSVLREAIAYVPQSTVADVVGLSIIRLYARIKEEGLGAVILMQVHDSIVVQTSVGDLARTVALVRACMDVPVGIGGRVLRIPVDVKVGENWEDMRKY